MKASPAPLHEKAESYYAAMLRHDFAHMASFLHPQVVLISPLAEVHGKENVTLAASKLGQILEKIDIRASFSNDRQAMLAYDFFFPGAIGKLRASVLMDFTEGLISRIELFYDGRPFEEKKKEIF